MNRKDYTLDELLEGMKPLREEDPIPGILDSEWTPYVANDKPFAYRVVDWRGEHVAVVHRRERAHAINSQTDFDPRLNSIYAVYLDETEKCVQCGLSIMDDLDRSDIDEIWKDKMKKAGVDESEIKLTLLYYQKENNGRRDQS